MKTAIDWLIDELQENGSGSVYTFPGLFKQAKELEKQQIFDTYWAGYVDNIPHDELSGFEAEQYYKRTYENTSRTT